MKVFQHHLVSFASMLIICMLFLSACSPATTRKAAEKSIRSPIAIPSPAVVPVLQLQGAVELETFQQWITLMQQYGGSVGVYQQQYASDQQAFYTAISDTAYRAVLKRLQEQINAIKLPATKTEATSLQQQLQQGATLWGQQHTYYDSYNQATYQLGYEYGTTGISSWAQRQLDNAQTLADYRQTTENLQMWLYNFQAYKADFVDRTPSSQAHRTDSQLMQHYGYTSGKVIVISLAEEAMRVYQDGHLLRAFLVVTGMPQHPSLPGTWWVEKMQTNITFTSGKQPGQEGYYPPTPVAYALQYHSSGYYIHQSWWRSEYGPYKQFPHIDYNGTFFAFEGTHGCVNMRTTDVQWLYNFATLDTTKIIIY